MRFSIGAILALLFASAVAVAQACPPGMSANYQGEPEYYGTSNLSRSGNLSSWSTSPTGIYEDYKIMVGSPFPMAANPALREFPEHGILPAEPTLEPPSMAVREAPCVSQEQEQAQPQEQEQVPQQQEQAPQQYQGNGAGY